MKWLKLVTIALLLLFVLFTLRDVRMGSVASDVIYSQYKTVGCAAIEGAEVITSPTQHDPTPLNEYIDASDSTVFCLDPNIADYGHLDLTSSGTTEAPKYLMANYTGDEIGKSPWDETIAQRSELDTLEFSGGASNWYVYGFRLRNDADSSVYISGGSQNIELRDVLIEGAADTILDADSSTTAMVKIIGSDNNSIFESVIRDTPRRILSNDPGDYDPLPDPSGFDQHCIEISDSNDLTFEYNEIYNCAGDGVHVLYSDVDDPDHLWSSKRLRIAFNSIYITDEMYADCDMVDPNTSLTTTGECACAENAVDIEMTHFDEPGNTDDVLVVTGNVLYGFRETHPTCGGTASSGPAITIHLEDPRDIRITRNVIADSRVGLIVDTDQATPNINVFNNIFYNQLMDGVIFKGTAGPSFVHNTLYRDLGNVLGSTDGEINSIEIQAPTLDYEVYNNRVTATVQDYSIYHFTGATGEMEGNYTEEFATIQFEDASTPPVTNIVDADFDPLNYDELCYEMLHLLDDLTDCVPSTLLTATSPLLGLAQIGYIPNVSQDFLGNVRDEERDPGAIDFGSSLAGDMDGDGDIQIDDYALFLEDYFDFRDQDIFNDRSDMDGNLLINIADYALWIDAYLLYRDG